MMENIDEEAEAEGYDSDLGLEATLKKKGTKKKKKKGRKKSAKKESKKKKKKRKGNDLTSHRYSCSRVEWSFVGVSSRSLSLKPFRVCFTALFDVRCAISIL